MSVAKSNWSKTETTHLLNTLKELESLLQTFIHTLLLYGGGRGRIEMLQRCTATKQVSFLFPSFPHTIQQ